MKELSIEEKAKRYDEALKAVKNLRELNPSDEGIQNWVNENFPEVKGSEDESIIRDIRVILESYVTRIFDENGQMPVWYDRAVAWLEKQGQVKESIISQHENKICKESDDSLTNEDERIRKAIHIYIDWLDGRKDYAPKGEYSIRDMIAWLEKQREHKPTDKVEHKFKVGDTIKAINEAPLTITKITNDGYWSEDLFICSFENSTKWELVEQKPSNKAEPKFKVGGWVVYECEDEVITLQIKNIVDGTYEFTDDSTLNVDDEDTLRLWTIQDAKDGDVLVADDGSSFIYNGYLEEKQWPFAYGGTNIRGWFYTSGGLLPFTHQKVVPATKEQRDLLFQKMKEAGYEWDAEKKELKKIEQEENVELTDFESALFSAFSYAWQEYLSGKKVNVAKWAREHSAELLEVAREQKPTHTWSEEDEKMYNSALWHIKNSCGNQGKNSGEFEVYNWLKTIKYRYLPQPKQEWSEED